MRKASMLAVVIVHNQILQVLVWAIIYSLLYLKITTDDGEPEGELERDEFESSDGT